MGQCGIIGSVCIPLIAAPPQISTFKLFYRDIHAFVEDVRFYVNSGKIDMIHAFLKPSTSVAKIVGGEEFAASSTDFQSDIKSCASGDLVLFLELGCYIWDTSLSDNSNKCLSVMPRQRRHIAGEVFHGIQSFQSYITRDRK